MTIRSRRNRTVDLGRLVAGIRGPNVDTRLWKVLAFALDESFVDEKHGVFVDVKCFPGGEEYTARVGTDYAGAKFGFYMGKIHKDDELEISIPLGDPAEGPVVSRRLWSAADLPPQEVIDHDDDVVLVVEKDKFFRVYVSGDGKIVFDNKKIRIGNEDADEKLVLGSTFRDKQKSMNDSLKTQFGNLSTALDNFNTALTTLSSSATFAGVLIPAAALAAKAAFTAFCTTGGLAISSAKQAADSLKSAVGDFETAGSNNQDFLSEVANVAKK